MTDSTEADIDQLLEQLQQKALWRDDIHRDLHLASVEAITKLRAERARCVGLCNMMAEKLQNRAVEIRAARTFTSRSLWPPFRKQFFVMPGAETGAQQHDEAARIVRSIAKAIDAGWPLDEVAIGKAEASSVMATDRKGDAT